MAPQTLHYTHGIISLGLVTNAIASLCVVFMSKWVFTHHGFPCLTLTCFHLVCTTLTLVVGRRLNVFQFKSLPLNKTLPLSLSYGASVMFTMLSLEANNVGSYQMLKALTTPAVLTIQIFFYKRWFSVYVKLMMVPIMFGVFLNLYSDLKFNCLGFVFGIIGAITTSLCHVLINEQQHELQVDCLQLLYYQAPIAATGLMFIIPFIEPVFSEQGLFSPWSPETVLLVSLSAIVAVFVNISMFWLIRKTSPLSYNMFGHLKYCAVLLFSFFAMHDFLSIHQVIGIFLTSTVVFLYGLLWFCGGHFTDSKSDRSSSVRPTDRT